MEFTVVSPPEKELLTLDEVKEHLRLIPGDDSEDEAILTPLITAAREYCENRTGQSFAEQEIEAYPTEARSPLYLPRAPVISVEEASITYNGEETDIPRENFTIGNGGYCVICPGFTWQSGGTAKIRYKAGHKTTPKLIRQAMLLLIGHWYENRETVSVGAVTAVDVPYAVKVLLNQYKRWWF